MLLNVSDAFNTVVVLCVSDIIDGFMEQFRLHQLLFIVLKSA